MSASYLSLLAPTFISAKRRLSGATETKQNQFRLVVTVALTMLFLSLVWVGTNFTLEYNLKQADVFFIPPENLLSFILTLFFALITVATSATAYGELYQSHDLDLLLTTATPDHKLFLPRITRVLIASTWFSALFVLPLVGAFCWHFDAGVLQTIHALITVGLYLLLASFLGFVLGLLSIKFIQLFSKAKRLPGVFSLFTIATAIMVLVNSNVNIKDYGTKDFVSIIYLPESLFSPVHWASSTIGLSMTRNYLLALPNLAALLFYTATVGALAFLLHEFCYRRFFSLSRSTLLSNANYKKFSHRLNSSPHIVSMLVKDFKCFVRNPEQVVQLTMLLGLCGVYVFGSKLLDTLPNAIADLNESQKTSFKIGSAILLDSFLILAISTRMIFPALSLEGRAMFLLLTKPLMVKNLVLSKALFWWLVILLLELFFTSVGGFGNSLRIEILGLRLVAVLSTSLIVCGAATYMGAKFINIKWEHSGQLAGSFGSIVCMLISTAIISVNTSLFWAFGSMWSTAYPPGGGGLSSIVLFCFAMFSGAMFLLVVFLRGAEKAISQLEL